MRAAISFRASRRLVPSDCSWQSEVPFLQPSWMCTRGLFKRMGFVFQTIPFTSMLVGKRLNIVNKGNDSEADPISVACIHPLNIASPQEYQKGPTWSSCSPPNGKIWGTLVQSPQRPRFRPENTRDMGALDKIIKSSRSTDMEEHMQCLWGCDLSKLFDGKPNRI